MKKTSTLEDISIRSELRSGDLGSIILMHAMLYKQEYGYGIDFEAYVANEVYEFYKNYDPTLDRIWIGEQQNNIIGTLVLMHREPGVAQLRFFIIHPNYRSIRLGVKMTDLLLLFAKQHEYKRIYLWTSNEQLEAASLYKKMGFVLSNEHYSTVFGKPVMEQRYDLVL